ncbi:MAG TPA: restriction endonuclease [Xanthobacteraceae bacterium]|nr:restriction endonuclease [Xanthobacteraceae bacterium]
MKAAAVQGREFEDEVASFLRSAGFTVTANARVAKPRQTDLFAERDEIALLVEAKDRKRKVDVGDVDALRSRLNRTSPDIIGAIFSTSGLTRGAIEAIEADRRREIIAFIDAEMEWLRSGSQNLNTLLERKRSELRIRGRAWFSSEISLEFVGVKLPPSSVEFRIGKQVKPYFESRSSFGGSFYSLQLPDSGWAGVGSEGARLSIKLTLNTYEDLRNILGYLQQRFGLSSNGMFWIQQTESCWHGVGAENFLQAVKGWSERYAQSCAKNFHHSEEFSYFDQFRDGWIEVSAQQRVDWEENGEPAPPIFYYSDLVIQLPGVPVDVSPFVKLCQFTRNEWAQFQYIGQRWTSRTRLRKSRVLNVVGLILDKERHPYRLSEERVVVGVIARNPFYRKKSLPKELLRPGVAPLDQLTETELILCSLRHWHGEGDVVDYYLLQGFEVTTGAVSGIIRPTGTWNKMLKSARDQAR